MSKFDPHKNEWFYSVIKYHNCYYWLQWINQQFINTKFIIFYILYGTLYLVLISTNILYDVYMYVMNTAL